MDYNQLCLIHLVFTGVIFLYTQSKFRLLLINIVVLELFIISAPFSNLFTFLTISTPNEMSNPYISAFSSGEIETRTHVKIKKHPLSNEYFMSFCLSSSKQRGLGNRLAAYWAHRALSFWWNIPFILDETCTCYKKEWFFCRNTNKANETYHKQWTNYLPHKSTININQLFDIFAQNVSESSMSIKVQTVFEDIFNEMDIEHIGNAVISNTFFSQNMNINEFKSKLLTRKKSGYIYRQFGHLLLHIYDTSGSLAFTHNDHAVMLSVVNEVFIEVLRYEMQLAFYLYFKQNNANVHNERLFMHSLMKNNNKSIVAVHWRCGDLLSENKARALPALSFYNNSITAMRLKERKNYVVYWLAQLDKTKARAKDKPNIDKCIDIMTSMKPHYSRLFFNTDNSDDFVIVSNGTIATDSYLLSNADYSIGLKSSFYEMLVLGNRKKVVFSGWIMNQRFDDMIKTVLPRNKLKVDIDTNTVISANNKSVDELISHIMYH